MSQEKTEAPTPHRLRELRQKGDVPRSQDATTAGVLIAGLLATVVGGPALAAAFEALWRQSLRAVADTSAGIGLADAAASLASPMSEAAKAALLPLAAICVAAVAVGFVQVGPLWSMTAFKPDPGRLAPTRNLGRVWSKRAVMDLVRAIAKIVLGLAVCYGVLRSELTSLLSLGGGSAAEALALVGHCAWRLGFFVAMLATAIGVLDLFYQRLSWLAQHRMSKEEIRLEHKQQEGDDQIKHERRRAHEEISLGQMYEEIDSGDTLVRNPIHVAVVLRFDSDRERAPRVIAKGRGHVARTIVARARKAGLAEQYDIRLARALHRLPLQSTIPEELFDAVSALLAWAESELRRNGRVPGWHKERRTPVQRGAARSDKGA